MNKQARIVALKLAQIIEEHSRKDIEDAVALLSTYQKGEELVGLISAGKASPAATGERRAPPAKADKSIEETASRAVLRLKESDSKKFQILSEFDQLVRSGRALRTNESLRRVGERLSKDFRPKKSRSDYVNAVMDALATRTLSEIRDYIEAILADDNRDREHGYQDLANFLIKGKSSD